MDGGLLKKKNGFAICMEMTITESDVTLTPRLQWCVCVMNGLKHETEHTCTHTRKEHGNTTAFSSYGFLMAVSLDTCR